MAKTFAELVLELLQTIPNWKSLEFLELSCGDGRLIESLMREGAKARGTTFRSQDDDYIRSRPYPPDVQVDGGVDLNQRLPYPDASFDVVYSSEVIEHVESHRNFIAESARLIRPGGYLVMSTPNCHRLVSRLHYALSGVHLTKERALPYGLPLSRMEEFHHRCVDFPVLHWILWNCGFRIDAILPESIHPASKLLRIFSPLSRRLARKALAMHGRSQEQDPAGTDDVLKWMNSPVLQTSERLILRARKISSSDAGNANNK